MAIPYELVSLFESVIHEFIFSLFFSPRPHQPLQWTDEVVLDFSFMSSVLHRFLDFSLSSMRSCINTYKSRLYAPHSCLFLCDPVMRLAVIKELLVNQTIGDDA
jgi:hypothetical protein